MISEHETDIPLALVQAIDTVHGPVQRLFGIRGGGAAEEALRERDVGWGSLERTAPEAFSR